MRIFHVHSGNLYGGIEFLLLELVRHEVAARPLEFHFALCFDGLLSRQISRTGAQVHHIGATRIRRPLTIRNSRRNLDEILRNQQARAVITHSAWSQALFGKVARKRGLPLIRWVHGEMKSHWLERYACRTKPDLLICNSYFTAQSAARFYRDVPSEVVYSPVSLPPAFSKAERDCLRSKLGVTEQDVVILHASRMESGKGHSVLIVSLELLRDISGWHCFIAGGAQRPKEVRYLQELKHAVNRCHLSDRIHFLGHRDDVSELMQSSDIYCQANTEPEGFGISFVQALAAGVPVVTSNTGGANEIVDATVGILVESNHYWQLSQALKTLILNAEIRRKLGITASERVQQLCDPVMQMVRFRELLINHVKNFTPANTPP